MCAKKNHRCMCAKKNHRRMCVVSLLGEQGADV